MPDPFKPLPFKTLDYSIRTPVGFLHPSQARIDRKYERNNVMDRQPLTFRSAKLSDTAALAELHFHSFPANEFLPEARERKFREHPLVNLDNFLLGEADGRVQAALNGIAFRMWVDGVSRPMLGIAGVVVAPEGRRFGYASDLVVECVRRARSQGVAFSALYPFRHSFYSALGYASAVRFLQWEFDPRDLPVYSERLAVRRGTADDLKGVRACYGRVARRSTLMIDRTGLDWKARTLAEGKRMLAVYVAEGGEIRGYFVYSYQEFKNGRHPRLFITELVHENETAFRGLLGYIAALRDQFLEVALVLPESDRLDLRLANPRTAGAIKGFIADMFGPKMLCGAMARVLDPTAALGMRENYNTATGRVRFEIDDRQIPENRAPLDVAFLDGRVEVSQSAEGASEATVKVGIGPFTQMFFGYATATELRRAGLLDADDDRTALLDRAFSGPAPTMYDQF